MDEHEELIGADLTEHMIQHGQVFDYFIFVYFEITVVKNCIIFQIGIENTIEVLKPYFDLHDLENTPSIGSNLGHHIYISEKYMVNILIFFRSNIKGFNRFLFNFFQNNENNKKPLKKRISVPKHSEAWLNNEIRNFNSNGIFPESANKNLKYDEYDTKNYVIKLPRVYLNNENNKNKNASKIPTISQWPNSDEQKKHSPFLWTN